MGINTRPSFYYGQKVTVNNIYINFSEGLLPLTAVLRAGSYTLTSLGLEVARALNSVGGQEYTVSVDRVTRKYTISAPSNFDLLFGTGDNSGLSVAPVIGFDSTDKLNANSHEGDFASGSVWQPQFPLQDFIGFDDYKELAQSKINESASGVVEVYTIGKRRFMQFNVAYTTNNKIGGKFEKDEQAVEKLRAFLDYATEKNPMQFMINAEDPNLYNDVLLEKTATSSSGTGYLLKELYNRTLSGFYETGTLTFREV